jgi:hypothetical protein
MKKSQIILEAAQSIVASGAKQFAHAPCLVIMIYLQWLFSTGAFVCWHVSGFANWTSAFLFGKHGVIFFARDAVEALARCGANAFQAAWTTPINLGLLVRAFFAGSGPECSSSCFADTVRRKVGKRQNLFTPRAAFFGFFWSINFAAMSAYCSRRFISTVFAHKPLTQTVAVVVRLKMIVGLMFAALAADFAEKIRRIALHQNSLGSVPGRGCGKTALGHFRCL